MKKNIFSKKKGTTSAPTKSGASSISKKNKINIALSVLLAIMVCLLIASIVLAVVSDTSNYGGVKGDKGEMGPQGIQGVAGKDGADGRGIQKIEKVSSTDNVDTYFIHYTDTSVTSFKVTNGLTDSLCYLTSVDSQADESPSGSAVNNFLINKLSDQRLPKVGDYFILKYSIPNSKGQNLVLYQLTTCSNVSQITSTSVNIGAAVFVCLGFVDGEKGKDGANGADGEDGRSIEDVVKSIEESTSEYDLYYVYYSDGSSSTFRIDLPEPGTKWEVLDLDVHRVTGRPTAALAIVSSSEEILELDPDCYYVANGLICTYIDMVNNGNDTITYRFNFHYDLNGVDGVDGADGVDGTNGIDGKNGTIFYRSNESATLGDSDIYLIHRATIDYSLYDRVPQVSDYVIAYHDDIAKLFQINNLSSSTLFCAYVTNLQGKDGTNNNSSLGLTVGQSIEQLVFNDEISIEKMTSYLANLTYDSTLGICELLRIEQLIRNADSSHTATSDYCIVYAIDLVAYDTYLESLIGTKQGATGYAIVINNIDNQTVQALFASEYSTANNNILCSALADGYVPNFTQAGWIDAYDLELDFSVGDLTINGFPVTEVIKEYYLEVVHDNKVSAFIGRDTRLWDVLSMFN